MNYKKSDITPEMLREFLNYDPKTGVLTWKQRHEKWFTSSQSAASWNGKNAGRVALGSPSDGYLSGAVLGVGFSSHRAAWAIYYGELPNEIDHINRDPSDNRIGNLRAVTRSENCRNRGLRADNKSGVPGVFWHSTRQKWNVSINALGVQTHVGTFKCLGEAVAARRSAEKEHGYMDAMYRDYSLRGVHLTKPEEAE